MSASDMPELGSKISLISKADIRYEGKLYAVDPQDCTIALASVRSFGTEERKTSQYVPPQAQVYDYILFRATDIKDISVVPQTQLLYDPAIVTLSSSRAPFSGSAPGGGGGAGAVGSAPNDYHQLSSAIGSGSAVGAGGSGGGGPMAQFSGFNPMQSSLLTRPSPSEFLHHHTNNELLSGSRSSTPGLRRSSPVDQPSNRKSPQKDDHNRQRNRSNSRNRSDNRTRNDSHNNQQNQHQNYQQNYQQNRGRQNYQQQGMQQGNRSGQMMHQHRNQMMRNQHQQGGSQQQGADRWGNRMAGNRVNHGQGMPNNRQNFSRAPGARTRTVPLKFESDYDFDKANNEFEEVRNELAKIKLEAPSPPVPAINGDDKKDDSGNETGALDQTEPPNEGEVYFYNKNKSFFDNISCEAIERSKGIQRTDWRKERKLNSETFGVSSARRNMYYNRQGYGYNNRQGNYNNRQGGFGGYNNRQGGYRHPLMFSRQRSQNRQQNTNQQAQVANA